MAKTKPGAKTWKRPPRQEPVAPPSQTEPEEFDPTIHTPEEWAQILGETILQVTTLAYHLGVEDQLPEVWTTAITAIGEAIQKGEIPGLKPKPNYRRNVYPDIRSGPASAPTHQTPGVVDLGPAKTVTVTLPDGSTTECEVINGTIRVGPVKPS